jgi:hypothetical protein
MDEAKALACASRTARSPAGVVHYPMPSGFLMQPSKELLIRFWSFRSVLIWHCENSLFPMTGTSMLMPYSLLAILSNHLPKW